MDANIWGFILQVLIAVGGVFAAVYVIKKDILDLKNDISHLKKDMELIKKDVGKVEGIEEYIKNLSCYFNDNKVPVPERLKQYESKLSRYYQSNSPVKLTEKGEKLIIETGFDKIFENKKDFIIQAIKQKLQYYWEADDDLFFYFAEKKSIEAMKEMYDEGDALLNPVRVFIFSHGLFEEENEIITALGIYVRDEIIKEANRWKRFEEIQKENKKEH